MDPLPNPFYGISPKQSTYNEFWQRDDPHAIVALVEHEMTELSASLRSKESWWTKFRDSAILANWRSEALEQANLMKESHVDYVLQELDGYAKLRDGDTGVEVACYDGVWKSDRLIPTALKAKLVSGVAKLENVPDAQKDWHPRSNETVLDLVHPSLYPIVYGRTLGFLEGSTERDATKLQPLAPPVPSGIHGGDLNYHLSRKFQWLPTDFIVSRDSKSVKSVNYINNLHPDEHRDLHETIEGLIGAFLPLFERVLTDLVPQNKIKPKRTTNQYSYDDNYKPAPDIQRLERQEYYRLHQEWEENRPILPPDVNPKGYITGSLELRYVPYSLAGKTIQVIVKLANIHLTPDKPEYAGGSWHVEGMSNEAIAASGIYYYDEENITQSRLAFRTTASPPENYLQDDTRGCIETWGVGRDDLCVNNLGAVVTCQDRAIAFPNIYQHKVSPFELKDKTKPGHRKIVALFLVDPAIYRPSTTTVPPQQHDWEAEAVYAHTAFKKLSPEVVDHINGFVEGTMSRAEAEAYRLELMDERKAFVVESDERFFKVTFDMCEH